MNYRFLTLSLPYCLLLGITSISLHFQVSLSRLYALSHFQLFFSIVVLNRTQFCHRPTGPYEESRSAVQRDLLRENDDNTAAKMKTKRRWIKSEEEGVGSRKKSCPSLRECRKAQAGHEDTSGRRGRGKERTQRYRKLITLCDCHIITCITKNCNLLIISCRAEMKTRQQRNCLCT